MQAENKPTAGFSYKGSRFGSPIHHKANSWEVSGAKLGPKKSKQSSNQENSSFTGKTLFQSPADAVWKIKTIQG